MSEPRRWVDDDAIEPALRDELRAARGAPPPPIDYEAGRAALRAAIRAGGAGGALGGGGTVAIVAATLAIVGAAALTWLGPATTRDHDQATAPPSAPAGAETPGRTPSAPAAPPTAPIAPAGSTLPEGTEPDPGPSTDPARAARAAESVPTTDAPAAAPVRPERGAAPEPESEPSTADVLREARATAAVRAALADDPARALALVDAADAAFGQGSFGEEREALRVLALAGLGRQAEARRLGERFLAAHEHGLFSERVRRAIARD